jgi:hypothetical protein
MSLGYGIQDLGSRIWDPGFGKNLFRIPGSKRHRISDSDPQHCFLGVYIKLSVSFVDTGGKFCRFHWNRWQICHRCSLHRRKFAASVIDTGDAPWLWYFFHEFWKQPLRYFQRLGGTWFMKKTWSKKSCDTIPLRTAWWIRAIQVVNVMIRKKKIYVECLNKGKSKNNFLNIFAYQGIHVPFVD